MPHPLRTSGGSLDRHARERLVCLVAGHTKKIGEELVLEVRLGEDVCRRAVRAAEVAGMTTVAAPEMTGRAFQHEHAGARLPGGQRGAETGVAAADDEQVIYRLAHRGPSIAATREDPGERRRRAPGAWRRSGV